MVLSTMAEWAKRKGINLLGSGDFTHPLWWRELKTQFKEVGEGIYRLSEGEQAVNFILTSEISCVYSQGGKGRRIHLVVLAPSLEVAYKINQELERRGFNLSSDGRPILGFSARNLVELLKGIDEKITIIPAHIWTPWFSLYGSRSGFDSLEECFGDMSQYIRAIETGLSSDPAANWQIRELDDRQIVSFSDAHSPEKIGREMTVLENASGREGSFSFTDITEALEGRKGSRWKIAYTIEFYPEEGKYHYSGHRRCGICRSPEETERLGIMCPVCGKPLTLGVMHQVRSKAQGRKLKISKETDRQGVEWIRNISVPQRPPYVKLVPLLEILSQSLNAGISTRKVVNEYNNLTTRLGSEREILLRIKGEEIKRVAGPRVWEGIKKVRGGDIVVAPGYDGQFGRVRVWGGGEKRKTKQMSFL